MYGTVLYCLVLQGRVATVASVVCTTQSQYLVALIVAMLWWSAAKSAGTQALTCTKINAHSRDVCIAADVGTD